LITCTAGADTNDATPFIGIVDFSDVPSKSFAGPTGSVEFPECIVSTGRSGFVSRFALFGEASVRCCASALSSAEQGSEFSDGSVGSSGNSARFGVGRLVGGGPRATGSSGTEDGAFVAGIDWTVISLRGEVDFSLFALFPALS